MKSVGLRPIDALKHVAPFILMSACVVSPAMQIADSGVRLTAETRLVEVVVNVRDPQGKPVKDLKQSDFTIIDNGKRRAFTIFSANDFDVTKPDAEPAKAEALPQRAPLPPNTFTNKSVTPPPQDGHSTVLMLDGINGYFESFIYARRGVLGLMNKVPADEKIALYVIAKDLGLEMLQDYTTDRNRLMQAMSKYIQRGPIPAPPGMDDSPDGHGMVETTGPSRQQPPPNARMASREETEYRLRRSTESVRLSMQALADRLRNVPGRKSIFWVTQGFPPVRLRDMDQFAWDKTIFALNDANIAVNTVDTDGLGGPRRLWGAGGILTMQQVAERTGGEAFFHNNDLAAMMAQGIADSRASYTLGFYLTDVDGKYHDLKVHVDRPGVQLNYRQGYWARSEGAAAMEARKGDLESVLLSPVDSVGVGITATIEVKAGTPRGTLTAHLKLDSESLSLKEGPGGWNGKVDEMFLEQNAAGLEVGRVSVTNTFQVAAAKKQAFDAQGAALSQTIPLAVGAVKLVIAVRDVASGRTGSLTVLLDQVLGR